MDRTCSKTRTAGVVGLLLLGAACIPAQTTPLVTPHARDEESVTPRDAFSFNIPVPEVRPPAEGTPAESISAEMLRHPMTKKARKLLAQAQDDSHAGNHGRAMRELNDALKEPSAEPYAHIFLAVEYLELRTPSAAIPELDQAARELPQFSPVHSNLALALCQTGQFKRCVKEVDTALTLDQGAARAHFLKGVILLEEGSADPETLHHLVMAEKEVPTARLALAIYYSRQGQDELARQQLTTYIGMRPGSTIEDMQQWLKFATSRTSAAEVLGVWSGLPPPGR